MPAREVPIIAVDACGTSETSWLREIDCARPERCDPGRPGRVAVLSPHPDDETLAIGGLLHDLVRRGWTVSLASVTDGEAAYPHVPDLGSVRRTELETALERLGLLPAVAIRRLRLPDGAVASHGVTLEAQLESAVSGAEWVLAPWPHDGHPDHDATGRAGRRVARALGLRIAFFPVWAWHHLEPTSALGRRLLAKAERWNLSPPTLAAKRRAIDAFVSQRDGRLGPPILPPHVLERFLRPFEIVLRDAP